MSKPVVMILPLRWWTSVYAIVLLAATFASAGCSSCGACNGSKVDPDLVSAVEPLRNDVHRGICVAHNYQHGGSRGYGTETSKRTLQELKALGANWVSLTPFGFMTSTTAREVRHIGDFKAGETDQRMVDEIAAAKALGLKVLVKPHLWLHTGEWRGDIRPKLSGVPRSPENDQSAWDAWFASYQAWVLHYAKLAEDNDVDVLTVGVELDHTARKFEDKWRALLAAVRAVYSGKLVYSVNWDRIDEVAWWDALDYIGVQFYPPVARADDASKDEMFERVGKELDALSAMAKRVERPILLTEVGYRSADGATRRPYEWPSEGEEAEVDLEEQARAYFALLKAVQSRPEIAGIYWWKWFTNPDTREEGRDGFSPRGKPAEALLRAAFRNGL